MDITFSSETMKMVYEWNFIEKPFVIENTIHGTFEKMARIFPDRTAVICNNRTLTYRELNNRANHLAHAIRNRFKKDYNQDMKPDELIGICVDRDIEMIVGILGILKSGGAYVPLDPRYPEDRIRFMAKDAGCRIILTQQAFTEQLLFMTDGDFVLISLDSGWESISKSHEDYLPDTCGPNDLAYVIYTSGSTGTPKGVLVTHSNVIRLFLSSEKQFSFSENDVWSCFHSYAFDFSVWEIWGALLYGGCLVIVPYMISRDPDQFVSLVNNENVTVLSQTPSAFYIFSDADLRSNAKNNSLRYIVYGGEALDIQKLKPWWEKYDPDSPELINMYGITETTVHTTFLKLSPLDLKKENPYSPIGKRLYDLTLYLLDDKLNPVPPGVPGELYVGGAGLARGYFNRPDLNNERFIDNPYATERDRSRKFNERLYKSGDLAQWAEDGSLFYIGRNDFQVKIRGFRIELGEIESVLSTYPDITNCVVTAITENSDTKLVAYYISRKVLPELELKNLISEKLPEYMMPQAFVPMEKFPLTPSGKLDRKSLPIPDFKAVFKSDSYVKPETYSEIAIAEIWQDVLGIEKIGKNLNFFEIGGHSLTATQVISRIRETFGIDYPFSEFFNKPVISEIASFIDEKKPYISLKAIDMKRTDRTRPVPLSFAQLRLWFLYKYEALNKSIYNIPIAFDLRGKLDINALEKSINCLLKRHESLRTVFRNIDAEPCQIINDYSPFTLRAEPVLIEEILDGLLSPEEIEKISKTIDTERLIESFLTSEANSPFDLENGPVFRVLLFKISNEHHILMLNMHHIITDGWSVGILLEELSKAYSAYKTGNEPELPDIPLQYADYSVWQRESVNTPGFENNIKYWIEKLKGHEEQEIISTNSRLPVKTYNGDNMFFTIDQELSESLKTIASQQNVTLYMLLLSAFKLLISRYTRYEDIILGSPIANRTQREMENVTGFFVNTLPLRTDLSGNPTFLELLSRIRKTCIEAYDHQDVPFEHIVNVLNVERDPSRMPLFQVVFSMQNATDRNKNKANVRIFNDSMNFSLPGLSIVNAAFRYRVAKFDITLIMDECEEGITGELEYNTDLFIRSHIASFVNHFKTLLKSISDSPETPVNNLNFLSSSEKRRILIEWNQTDRTFPDNLTIQAVFEDIVRKFPQNTAVTCDDKSLSYNELNIKANRLAWTLKEKLCENRETKQSNHKLIGLCIDRGIDEIVAMLGILKAGAGYVPIDTGYPEERIKYVIEDAGISLLITDRKTIEKAPHMFDNRRNIILADDETEKSPENPPIINNSKDLAYVIYTSGSTGKPKGVMIDQRSVIRFIKNQNIFAFDPNDCFMHVMNISFDAATGEIWAPLLNGAKLVPVPKDTVLNPVKLTELMKKDGVNSTLLSTALFNLFIESHSELLLSLKNIAFGGEEANPEKVKYFFSKITKNQRLLNVYGPTEATVIATICHITDEFSERRVIPIGKPVNGKLVYILDNALNPVPVGVPGELYIGGTGIAKGYLNNPGLTEEKFINNPFANLYDFQNPDDNIIYKTGDLVRWQSDGNIVFIGRTDFQVKIRGFRIEPGEIESIILKHTDINDCIVVVHKIRDDKTLVAYFSTKNNKPLLETELKLYLKAHLPEYMIPGIIIKMDSLPINPNGKIDRNSLPSPEISYQSKTDDFLAPETEEEKIIAKIWQEILNIEKIGILDNFFSLGGHSLSATRVASRIEGIFGIECPIKTIFKYPDISQLASFVREHLTSKAKSETLIEKIKKDDPIPLSYAQERLWFLDQFEGTGSSTYNIPLAFRLKGFIDTDALTSAIKHLIKRHESLRTVFISDFGIPFQKILKPEEISFRIKHEKIEADLISERLKKESLSPFDLTKGPLFRFFLFNISEEENVILFMWHHIISDGWSINILLKELSALYRTLSIKGLSHLKSIDFQYADFAVWQKKWLEGKILDSQITYWKKKLNNYSNIELPTDFPRPASKTFEGKRFSFFLDNSLTEALRILGRQNHSTLFMVLLTGCKILLSRYSGQYDIILGSPIANRNHNHIENMTGFFVNTLALRSNLKGNPSFKELLLDIRKTCIEAFENQDVPFENLVNALDVKRDAARTPIFQVFFSLQNADELPLLSIPGVKSERIDTGYNVAKFDLTFSFVEQEHSLLGEIEYNSDLYEPGTIHRMANHIETILSEIAINPEKHIDSYTILTEEEREQVLFEWNNTETAFMEDRTISSIFKETAEKFPERTAISKDREITYRELYDKVNSLSKSIYYNHIGIREESTKKDTTIAICLDRSIETVISILGILRAGCAFVPIDMAYPDGRIEFLLSDSGSKVVISDRKTFEKKPFIANNGRHIIFIDEPENNGADFEFKKAPEDLCYVIYTSGSTGKPKGVLIEEKSVINMYEAKLKELGLHNPLSKSIDDQNNNVEIKRFSQFVSISFDVAISEIFTSILSGNTLYIVPEELKIDHEKLLDYLYENRINCTTLPAALLSTLPKRNMPHLETIITGGSFCVMEAINFWSKGRKLINEYGPTENTVFSSYKIIEEKKSHDNIGIPIQNVRAYVLDEKLNPLPHGIPGELYLSGSGLARGYLNRPDLNESAFIINPFATPDDIRKGKHHLFYKTGDYVKRMPDGSLKFLGRKDSQVKIRGFRIETGEIEWFLSEHEDIMSCVVIPFIDEMTTHLISYYVLKKDRAIPSFEDLRNHLAKTLPDYMIPAVFIRIDEIPLTANEKINVSALPSPQEFLHSEKSGQVEPGSDVEKEISRIWQELLRLPKIGIDDNFFSIGGHSLIVTQVASKLNSTFKINLPVKTIFSKPSIRKLAEYIETLIWAKEEDTLTEADEGEI